MLFDLDQWQEILSTIRKNKLRTVLTGISVAWGIFMLVILMGSGNGLAKGVIYNFSDAKNSIWMGGEQTSKAYKGLNAGRRIDFTNDDINLVANRYKGVDNLSARFGLWGTLISYKNNYGNFEVTAINPGHQVTEALKLMQGRFLNLLDVKEFRKTAIIGKIIKEQIFKDENPIDKFITIRGIPFKVVGVFDDIHEGETKRVYIPISIAQKTFITKNQISAITFTTGDATVSESNQMIDELKHMFARKFNFDPEDTRAMWSWNALKEYQQMQSLFNGINLFVLIIGIFTIIAGVVGVSNIMLIVVKERTKEIGIRKAIGAKPASIVWMIILESILITAIAGYIGLLGGVAILESIAKVMPATEFFRNPGIDFGVAIGATVLIVVAGALAGFIPARRAASIRPVVALHDE
jgi:putative ABC transport system permease protein